MGVGGVGGGGLSDVVLSVRNMLLEEEEEEACSCLCSYFLMYFLPLKQTLVGGVGVVVVICYCY